MGGSGMSRGLLPAGVALLVAALTFGPSGYAHFRGASASKESVRQRGERRKKSKKKGSGRAEGSTVGGSSEEDYAESRRSIESKVSNKSSEEDEGRPDPCALKKKGAGTALSAARKEEDGERSASVESERKVQVERGKLGASQPGLSGSSEEEGGDNGVERGERKKSKAKKTASAVRLQAAAMGSSEEESVGDGWSGATMIRGKRRTLKAAPGAGAASVDAGAGAGSSGGGGGGMLGGQQQHEQQQQQQQQQYQAFLQQQQQQQQRQQQQQQQQQCGEADGGKGRKHLSVALPRGSPIATARRSQSADSGEEGGGEREAEERRQREQSEGEKGISNKRASRELMGLLGIMGMSSPKARDGEGGEAGGPAPDPPSPGATIMALLGHARVRPSGSASIGMLTPEKHPSDADRAVSPIAMSGVAMGANGADTEFTPKLRKRRPRRDLDFSLCHPCGLYNGSGSNLENLCFFNAAIQLLFHAIKDLASDLNRCTGAVALAVRGLGEEVIKLQPSDGAEGKAGEVSKDTSERLRCTLSEHFSYLECPPSRQSQCDAYEFLEGLLEVVREDVREHGGVVEEGEKKAVDKRLHEKMGVVAQESRREPVVCASLLESLHNMADLKWAMDMHGRPDAMESKPAAVTFAGQMITLTYDKAKRGLRRCEFEPFSVWAVPLQGETGGCPMDGVKLEQLLVSYCSAAAPEGGEGLLRRTALWRLPDSLVICLRRFDNHCQKLGTAVKVPSTLDFRRGSTPAPNSHSSEREVCVFGGGFGEGGSAKGASVADGCTFHVQVPEGNGCCRSSPAAEEGAAYDLSGVCYHLGATLDNGHYVAAVKGRGEAWWECNDSHCTEVNLEQVLAGTVPSVRAYETFPSCSRTVYVMVYRKR